MSSQWLNGTSLKDSLDGKGRVMVDENLRIKDRKNVFAIGDITNILVSSQDHNNFQPFPKASTTAYDSLDDGIV